MSKRNKSPRAKQVLGKSGRWLFLLLILVQNWLCIDAAAGRLEPEEEAELLKIIIVSDAVEKQMEKLPRKWKRPEGADWTETRKEEEEVKVHLAKWISVEHRKEVHEKVHRKVRYLLWNRAQIEKMEEQSNKEAKEGWRFAASAARIN